MKPGQGPSRAQSPRPQISLWAAADELAYLLISDMLRGWWWRERGAVPILPPPRHPAPTSAASAPRRPVSPLLFLNDKEGCSPIGWNPPQTVWRRLGRNRPHCARGPGLGVNTAKHRGTWGIRGERPHPRLSCPQRRWRGSASALQSPRGQTDKGPQAHSQAAENCLGVSLCSNGKTQFFWPSDHVTITLALEPTFYPFHSEAFWSMHLKPSA